MPKTINVPVLQTLPAPSSSNGLGTLQTSVGNLPLTKLAVEADVCGVFVQTIVRQTFKNPTTQPLEAVYIFPLPDRAGVADFTMRVGSRVIQGVLQEREQARQEYEQAIRQGHRASMLEEERPNVFTISVGNLMPGETAEITLTLNGLLELDAGEATFRFPLVVAPRYIPGVPLDDDSVGYGVVPDTDAVPDASRITPPVLLPGFPNPVELSIEVRIDGRTIPVQDLHASLHTVAIVNRNGLYTVRLDPGYPPDRDFILRFRLASQEMTSRALLAPDPNNPNEGTLLTLICAPDTIPAATLSHVVFLVDRSGSMEGWKMDAARRAAGRLIDSLAPTTHFQLLAFDNTVEAFAQHQWSRADNRSQFAAIQWLAQIDARGGTELYFALQEAVQQLRKIPEGTPHSSAIVLITDGQVGNDEQILKLVANSNALIHVIGIDEALNDALLRRIAEQTGGVFTPIESEDRLDEMLQALRERLSLPLLTDITVDSDDIPLIGTSATPKSPVNLYAQGVAYVLQRWQGNYSQPAVAQVHAKQPDGTDWQLELPVEVIKTPVLRISWARHMVRMLEDLYYLAHTKHLENRIVDISTRYGVLSRFTAYVAIERDKTVKRSGEVHRIVQPVSSPPGWDMMKASAPPTPPAPPQAPSTPRSERMMLLLSESDSSPWMFALLCNPAPKAPSNPWQGWLDALERLELHSPPAVDKLLLRLMQVFDSWLWQQSSEGSKSPQAEQVRALMDALLEHFQRRWDENRVRQLLAQCEQILRMLMGETAAHRRTRWW